MTSTWLFPPKFDDDQADYVGRIIHASLASIFFMALSFELSVGLLLPSALARTTAFSLMFLLVSAVLLIVNRRNPTFAGQLLVAIIWLLVTGAVITAGGVHAPALFAYFVLIIICTFVFSFQVSVAMLTLAVLSILLMAWLERTSLLPKPWVLHTPFSAGVVWSEGLVVCFAIVAVASTATREYLTRQRETAARLRESNYSLDESIKNLNARVAQLEFVHQSANVVSWVWDIASGRIEWFGDRDLLVGRPAGTFSGHFRDYLGYLHPDDQDGARQTVVDCLKGLTPKYRRQERIVLPDGGIRWLGTVGQAEYGPDGRALRMAGVVSDITQERLAHEELSASERRYRELFDSALDGIAILAPNGTLIDVNRTCCTETGFSRAELVGRSFSEFFPAEDVPDQQAQFRTLGQGSSAMTERRVRRKDGRLLPVEINAGGLPDGNIQAILRDISARKVAEERFAQIFQLAPNAIVISKMSDRRVVDVNKAFEKIFGYAREEAIGRTGAEIGISVSPDVRERFQQMLLDSRSVRGLEVRIRRKSGELADVILDADVMEFEGELHMVVSANDVTSRKRAEAEIVQLNATLEERVRVRTTELQEANQDLESFSYSISHDLRAPLRVIAGFTQILNKEYGTALPSDAQRLLGRVEHSAKRMGTLIDDLLSFSRIGKDSPKRSRLVDMRAEVKALIDELDLRGKIELGDLPHVHGDPSLLRQVWQNLILNAVKFSRNAEKPVVRISGSRLADGRVEYMIEDNGVGFDMAHAGRLFGVFQRLHTEREFEGTGVGLAIVHRILSRQGGNISAQSAPGKGARFTFILPGAPQLNPS